MGKVVGTRNCCSRDIEGAVEVRAGWSCKGGGMLRRAEGIGVLLPGQSVLRPAHPWPKNNPKGNFFLLPFYCLDRPKISVERGRGQ